MRPFLSTRYWLAALASAGALLIQAADVQPLKPADLYRATNVWSVLFTFTPDQWAKMEPQGGQQGFFGGPPGPGGARRLGGPGGGGLPGPGRGGGFGPGMFLAPMFVRDGDENHDGKLSEAEFTGLGQKWFTSWDKQKTGNLNADQLRAGVGETMMRGGPGGPGGPGGGRGPAMNLRGPEGARNGLSSAAGIEFEYVHADLEFEGEQIRDVAVRYKGNGTFMQSRDSAKRSLKVDLGKYSKGRKLAGVSKLNFHNNVTDASWMNEVLSHRLFRDAGLPAPRTAYARVYVTVPGKYTREYFGLYSMVEDVDQEFAAEHFGSKKGAIFKPVTPAPFTDLGDQWAQYNQTYDPKTKLTPAQQQRLIDFCKLVSHANDAEFNARFGRFVDLNEFARFLAVEVWLSTLDSILTIGQNYYVYLSPNEKQFQFIPWDLDHSFGQFFLMGTQEERENLTVQHPWRGGNRFLERVFLHPEFKRLYRAELERLNETLCRPERIVAQVDELAAAIRPAVQQESAEKLERFDQVVRGEGVPPAGFGGGFRGPQGFGDPAKPIKSFVKVRVESVSAQLEGKSEGETLPEFGFGGPGGPGGPRGRGALRGPGGARGEGPGGFGPGAFLGNAFMEVMDADKDGMITRDEWTRGFEKWFRDWDLDGKGFVNEEQLSAGLTKALMPRGFGPPRGQE